MDRPPKCCPSSRSISARCRPAPFRSTATKRNGSGTRASDPLDIFECPARIDARLQAAIEDVVLRAYRVLGCRDWSRIDVRLDAAGVPNIVEVNPLPEFSRTPKTTPVSKAARAAGLSYDQLIQERAPARRRAV
jgi:hypothetical protein